MVDEGENPLIVSSLGGGMTCSTRKREAVWAVLWYSATVPRFESQPGYSFFFSFGVV